MRAGMRGFVDPVPSLDVLDPGAAALELANELRTRAYRCYVGAYLD
jgi:hypothetical protein